MCDWARYRYWPDWICTPDESDLKTVSDIVHNSGDFIAFLQKLDRAYPEHHQIRLVLDNHSAHISKETRGYLQTMPQRFIFVFTPKHGSWLNLIENQFSKMTRTMLRGIRVASKQELIDRIHQYFEEINAAPVVFLLEALQDGRGHWLAEIIREQWI